jgi:uncharacterized protein
MEGKLKRTEYLFTGLSYKDFHAQFQQDFGDDAWIAYLLSGGSPVAAREIWQTGRIPEYFFEMIRDWIVGEVVKSGRSRQFLIALMRTLFIQAGSRTGYLKLARESGLANNTIASEYVEQLSDLLTVVPSFQWDADKDVPLQRKPAKFHFINLSVARGRPARSLRPSGSRRGRADQYSYKSSIPAHPAAGRHGFSPPGTG